MRRERRCFLTCAVPAHDTVGKIDGATRELSVIAARRLRTVLYAFAVFGVAVVGAPGDIERSARDRAGAHRVAVAPGIAAKSSQFVLVDDELTAGLERDVREKRPTVVGQADFVEAQNVIAA